MEETRASKRVRINVATTSKGVHSYDCTIDMTDASIEEVLAESDRLVAELEARYGKTEE